MTYNEGVPMKGVALYFYMSQSFVTHYVMCCNIRIEIACVYNRLHVVRYVIVTNTAVNPPKMLQVCPCMYLFFSISLENIPKSCTMKHKTVTLWELKY